MIYLIYLFIYLPVLGLSYGMQDLPCNAGTLYLRRASSVVAARRVSIWGMQAYLLSGMWDVSSLTKDHSSKVSILHSAFFIVQLSRPNMTTGKTIALTRWTLELLGIQDSESESKSCVTLCKFAKILLFCL